MQKNAIIFHGTGGNPDVVWLKWLGRKLEDKGYNVEIPHYPEINIEPITTFLPKILSNHQFNEQTVILGHSAGAALLLSILEHIDVTISQAILVAGYMTRPDGNDDEQPVLQDAYDFEKIKSHVEDIYFINSVTDPYGCDEKQGRMMFERVGGTLIIKNDGHFGTEFQDYPTFPLLDKLIV